MVHSVPQEDGTMSIDVMEVSDLDGNDVIEVPPSPRPPAQPRHRQSSSRPGAMSSSAQNDSRPPAHNERAPVYVDRPQSRNKKQQPPTAEVSIYKT